MLQITRFAKRINGKTLVRALSARTTFVQTNNTIHSKEQAWWWPIGSVVTAAVATGTIAGCEAAPEEIKPGLVQDDLPTYRLTDVEAHSHPDIGIWVVFRNGVYDITKFIAQHPGGAKKILLASGKSIEPFWGLYAAHHHPEVYQLLEKHRIGNLHPEDVKMLAAGQNRAQASGPYANEPTRHPLLKVNSDTPFNAEPPAELLMTSFITPNDLFFVRNHLPVPQLDEKDVDAYRLKISGKGLVGDDGNGVVELSLEDLKSQFKHYSVVTTVQCAGNRRSEMSNVKQVKGLSWDKTAIGTASWTGVRLADVLAHVGVGNEEDGQNPERQHIHFEGMDKDVDGTGYGASIPIATATDPRKDVLLAFEMNGEPIPRDHGFPLRAIVPGTVGARNVKYLDKIVVSSEESGSFWQQKDYKGFPPNVDYNTADYWTQAGPSIQELPVQSAITEPQNGSIIDMSEEGRSISDVSLVGISPLRTSLAVENRSHRQPYTIIESRHPLRITRSQIVISGNDVHSPARQREQTRGQCGDQCLSLTSGYLRNLAILQRQPSKQLDIIGPHVPVIHRVICIGATTELRSRGTDQAEDIQADCSQSVGNILFWSTLQFATPLRHLAAHLFLATRKPVFFAIAYLWNVSLQVFEVSSGTRPENLWYKFGNHFKIKNRKWFC